MIQFSFRRATLLSSREAPSAERFAIGDRYDLLLDYGKIATVTLTTLVGSEMDEEVGNDSFIGALATVREDDMPYLSKNIFVLKPHRELLASKSNTVPNPDAVYPSLQSEPVRFDIQQQILTLLKSRLKSKATETEQLSENMSPTFVVQAFRLTDGTLRYYARAAWTSEEEQTESWKTVHALCPRSLDYALADATNIGVGRTHVSVCRSYKRASRPAKRS